jgi:hypothetical protein
MSDHSDSKRDDNDEESFTGPSRERRSSHNDDSNGSGTHRCKC